MAYQFYEKTSQGVRDQNLDGLACNLFSVGQERPQKKGSNYDLNSISSVGPQW